MRQHRVDVECDSDLLVHVDPRLTASALAHLIENAAQYSPPESPVTVRATVPAEGLLIEVLDGGPGIDPSELAQIFERFYRGRVAKQRATGTGMGLAIARGMLAAEGGRVWADNRPEGGAVFCIAVPADRRPATPVAEVP